MTNTSGHRVNIFLQTNIVRGGFNNSVQRYIICKHVSITVWRDTHGNIINVNYKKQWSQD